MQLSPRLTLASRNLRIAPQRRRGFGDLACQRRRRRSVVNTAAAASHGCEGCRRFFDTPVIARQTIGLKLSNYCLSSMQAVILIDKKKKNDTQSHPNTDLVWVQSSKTAGYQSACNSSLKIWRARGRCAGPGAAAQSFGCCQREC